MSIEGAGRVKWWCAPEVVASTAISAILFLLLLVGVHRDARGSRLLASNRVARSTLLFHRVLPTPVHLSPLWLTILVWTGVILIWGVYFWLIFHMRSRPVSLWLVAGASVVLYAVALLFPPDLSSDVFSYAIFGRLISVYDANPYLTTPAHIAAADPLTPYLSWANISSPYGPIWSLISGAVARGDHVSPLSLVIRFKLLALSAILLDCRMIYQLVRHHSKERAAWAYLAFAWNPLVLIDGIVNGHNDVVVLAFALGAALILRSFPRLSVFFLVASALIKYSTLPMLGTALARYLKRSPRPPRPALIASTIVPSALVVVAVFQPFWHGIAVLTSTTHEPGRGVNNPVSGLTTWGLSELFAEQAHLASSVVAVGTAALLFCSWQLAQLALDAHADRAWTIDDELGNWARAVLVFLLVWPRVHTWYWLLPLGLALAAGPRYQRLAVVVVVTSLLGYVALVGQVGPGI